ncbi:hypothetical protein BDV93DRAFT_603899 [Ceratobasidium sp. AG-I]|nr:hypothetical protein BDV93DRAFT_603899 [Ceratobasidium sp. AG-I]
MYNTLAFSEHERSAWTDIVRAKDDEIATLKNKLVLLKNKLTALKAAKNDSNSTNPLIVCLIDGDGCIFNKDLLMLGTEGGREAASWLRQHIVAHHGTNADILVHVFFNREGLGRALKTHLNLQPATFSAFINGFNTASPLMSMLDVGAGKEAADAKIRELMRIFVRYPHVKKIYFGGGHDNGYTTNLTMIQNEGYLHKIVLLQSYTQLAAEIKALGLPRLENNGVFLFEKLSVKSTSSGSGAGNQSTLNPIGVTRGNNSNTNIDTINVLRPRPCIYHYLYEAGCPEGRICPHVHWYAFTPDMLAAFRVLLRRIPCPTMVEGQGCIDPECPSAHQCPQGPNCALRLQGTCKFQASGMHGSHASHARIDSSSSRAAQ